MDFLPRLELGSWVEAFVEWLQHAAWFFNGIDFTIEKVMDGIYWIIALPPSWLFVLIIAALTYWTNRKWGLTVFVILGLLLIDSLGFWNGMLDTLALVLTACLISVVIGVPVGILMAKNDRTEAIIKPVLDFMQTMPAFVYLIPAVAFFGIGMVPGVVASVIFAMPPTVRMTNLGIRQVSTELIEAADAFGSTGTQKLFKVQLPMARGTIMAGINQSTMLALSMVVIAAMIGATGIGQVVYSAVGQNNIGNGFEGGIAIVILAIILDRLTQSFNKKQSE
ncbi:proline/glycine betaine ABC transporter permease [Shouchella clausii]|uniref:Glycine betaine ABC transporter permease n=1 Tax=Shouchella clausii (strain KSM-K16) TaxID=66692 RepID=Q5WJ44_SHOC1|nr:MULTISPECIES: proline/glycine betaine ABC transporter permease [Shouchella]ALA51756.1 Glycine betaine ABC transport system, permease protein OpuAB [Shouchella clausii]MBU3232204.1 proline/glycine betaine ABC transporter permease [Shouchella clausii]MBU3264494.1 proline/glycine betaine ABC transporter permease [Shouchella clausii]MBU3508386.1 proline/glycine betaine ABC transporter permease [Shouchella clausii]MBU3536551.1 proline/glycine betaine ABC transporter permease [Shouchella clausii]